MNVIVSLFVQGCAVQCERYPGIPDTDPFNRCSRRPCWFRRNIFAPRAGSWQNVAIDLKHRLFEQDSLTKALGRSRTGRSHSGRQVHSGEAVILQSHVFLVPEFGLRAARLCDAVSGRMGFFTLRMGWMTVGYGIHSRFVFTPVDLSKGLTMGKFVLLGFFETVASADRLVFLDMPLLYLVIGSRLPVLLSFTCFCIVQLSA